MEIRTHRIEHGEETVLFFCDSLSIEKVEKEDADCIDRILAGMSEQQARAEGEPFLLRYRKNMELLKRQKSCPAPEPDDPDTFSTLILHVANDCNMECAYCFANHGTYASAPSMMSPQTARAALERYISRYRRIREIKFFGGEPLMNLPAIEAACACVCEQHAQGRLDRLPRFKVITNGTILTAEIAQTVIRYNIQVVFSLDGPASIHDALRYFPGRNPSWQRILENFRRWREYTGGAQPCSIETTYTQAHIDAGWSIPDLVHYFQTELGMKPGQVNVSLVNLPKSDPLSIPDAAACWSGYASELIDRRRTRGDLPCDLKLMGLIYRLKQKKTAPEELCPAGKTWSAVSAEGRVYPCLMFMDNDRFFMGDVREDLFRQKRCQEVVRQFQNFHPKQHPPCSTCFANRVCNQCAGINFYMTGNPARAHAQQCDAMRRTIEALICGIADGLL